MRFLYTTASLALFAAAAQAYSTGSPVCKSDADTLNTVAKAGKMGTLADTTAFAKTWSFMLWDDQGKQVTGDSIMSNMDYWVTVAGGSYKGVMTYPMFDGSRVPMAKEANVVTLTAGDTTNFGSAKCAGTVGQTITHMTSDDKDAQAKVAKVKVLDEKAGKFMMSGIVVTGKGKFGKAVTQQYNVMAGAGGNTGGNNGTDNGNTDNTGGNGGNTDNTGGTTGAGGDGTGVTNGNGTDPAAGNGASSISFVRPAIALQLVALAAFVLI